MESIRLWTLMPAVALLGNDIGAVKGAPVEDPRPACVVAAEWVAAHAGELPATEAGLAPFSTVYRKAIYRALPMATKRELWREHLTARLDPTYGLNDIQRAIVADAIQKLDVFFDPAASRSERLSAIKLFETMAMAAGGFSRAQRVDVFARLGPAGDAPETNPFAVPIVPSLKTQMDWSARWNRLGLRHLVCECNVSYGCNGVPGSCSENSPSCQYTEEGCGTFQATSCDGMCTG